MKRTSFLVAMLFMLSVSMHAQSPYAVTVQITLSPDAAAKLSSLHEGMVVSASYAGEARPGAKRHADQIGQIDLGSDKVEVAGAPITVHLSGTGLKKTRLRWTQGPPMLNINVYSARRSGPDNILACDFFDGELRHATAKPVALHCTLITERVATKALSVLEPLAIRAIPEPSWF